MNIPENLPLKNVLETAKRGIQVLGPAKDSIGRLPEEMLAANGYKKVALILFL